MATKPKTLSTEFEKHPNPKSKQPGKRFGSSLAITHQCPMSHFFRVSFGATLQSGAKNPKQLLTF